METTTHPNARKSWWIIGIFLFINFSIFAHPYIENEALYDFALLFGIRDFFLGSLIFMVIPIFVGAYIEECDEGYIRKLCVLDSVIVWVLSVALYVFHVTSAITIGWITSILYYFVNKHVLMLFRSKPRDRRSRIMSASLATALAVLLFLMSYSSTTAISKSLFYTASVSGNTQESEKRQETTNQEGYTYSYAGVRIVTYQDEETATILFNRWKRGAATEASIIELMDTFGAEQGGSQILYIYPGEMVEEIDSWCRDGSRKIGDAAVIESVYGYSICYISELGPI